MESETLVETLEDAGLSPYQAEAYVTVLELGRASATDIAKASGVPAPRIYDVLQSLSERGYVETYEQGSTQARAHSPADVLEDLRGRADRFETAAEEIEDRWEQPELEGNEASVVKRFQTVVDRARMFIEDAENQIHVSVTPEEFDYLRDSLREAHERGVPVHVSVHTALGEDPPSRDRFVGTCKEARHRELPTPFVALIDRQKTCFARNPESFDQYGVLVNDKTHTFVFHWYFMTCLWEHASTIYSERSPDPPVEYVDIRHFVREVQPALESDTAVTVKIEGTDLDTGDDREIVGTVENVRHVAHSSGKDTEPELAGQVMLLVDTGEEMVSVGGWGAVVEDVETTRIIVESIDRPDRIRMPVRD